MPEHGPRDGHRRFSVGAGADGCARHRLRAWLPLAVLALLRRHTAAFPPARSTTSSAWLATCEYVSDVEQFHEPDLWQQPCDFERRQRGDCEDFALWAWRKLIEIGIEAEFYVGRILCGGARQPRVSMRGSSIGTGRDAFLFEPAARDRQRMIQPWSAVKDDYEPHFAVDRRFVTSAFVGCIQEPR